MDQQLRTIIARIYNIDLAIASDNHLFNIIENSDSLRVMTLIATIEAKYCITFSDAEIMQMLDLSSITRILDAKIMQTSREMS